VILSVSRGEAMICLCFANSNSCLRRCAISLGSWIEMLLPGCGIRMPPGKSY